MPNYRPHARHLLNALCFLSLLLCVGLGVLWVRSLSAVETLFWASRNTDPPSSRKQRAICWGKGRFGVVFEREGYPPLTAAQHSEWSSLKARYPEPTGW